MTDSFLAEPPKPRLFSARAVGVGTFVGGPLAAGALIGLNYRRLGNRRAANWAIAGGALTTVLMFWGIFSIPSEIIDRIPRELIPAVYTPLAAYLAARLQGDAVKKAIEGGARKASAWATAGWSIACLIAMIGMVIPFALAQPPLGFHGGKYAFGPGGAYQIYSAGDVEAPKCAALEEYLERVAYFEGGNPRAAQVVQERGAYTVSLAIARDYWEKPDLLEYLGKVRADLEESILKGHVTVVLVDEDLARTYRKELPRSDPPKPNARR